MLAVDVCSRLDRSLFDPMVLFMYPGNGPMPNLLAQRGVPSYNLKRTRVRRLMGPLLPALILRRLRIDLLHVHHIPLLKAIMPAVRLTGIHSVVFTEHARFSISRSLKLQEACRTTAVNLGSFTTVSHDLKAYFVNELGIPAGVINVIHNGVDTTRFVPGKRNPSLKSLLPPSFTGFVLVTVGRLTDAKDHGSLLSALAILEKKHVNLYTLVIGDGELRHCLEKEIAERQLCHRIHLAGRRSDIDQLLPGADAFIMPSKREGLPIAILEAMSSGLPVIATSVGGIPEVVDNEVNGLIVPPENPAVLAAAIYRIYNDKILARTLGKNARKTIEEKFSLDRVAENYSKVYQDLVQKTKNEISN